MINVTDVKKGCWVDYHGHQVRIHEIYEDKNEYDIQISSDSGIEPRNPVSGANLYPIRINPDVLTNSGFKLDTTTGKFTKVVNGNTSLRFSPREHTGFDVVEIKTFPSYKEIPFKGTIDFLHILQIRYHERYDLTLDFDPKKPMTES